MTIDPQVLRSERHADVGRIIQRDIADLIERWSFRAVDEQPQASRVHHAALLDDLPRFLQSLGHSLADSTDPDRAPHTEPARSHGEQRWDDGWSLAEVVRDYQILRLVIFDHLAQVLDRQLTATEVQAVGLALDEAITSSVAAYVRQRDAHTRGIEEQLRTRASELGEADRRKNEFLAVLAHELRNPLAPILNSVEVLRLLGPTDASVIQARDIVERQVKQMVRLVDDLLDVTRIAQCKVELRRTTFDVASAVGQAVQTTAALYRSQRHHLTVHLPDQRLCIEADHARVVQVLVNLLNNAAKYTDPGGQIELTVLREDDFAVMRVRDNGIGIEAAMLGSVFELFTQVGRSLGRSQGGLGIGLTLVRQLVELHGGAVTVRSAGPGTGSEFEIRLLAAATADSAEPAPSPTPAIDSRHILIVEDNADARSTLRDLLELQGHRVEVAATGQDGISRALFSRPQVALIDLGLPGMDGCSVARRIREEMGPGILLIALTGHALEEDRRRTQAAGFNAHLVKPVELSELTRVLETSPVG
jgi:signal transduction histidine kinase